MKMFKNWGMTKQFVLIVGLIIGSFGLKHFCMCYSGIDEEVMWMRIFGNQIMFPRFLWVFGIVNILLPGVLVLFFKGIEDDVPFLQASFGVTNCLTVAAFTWHFVYMYPEVDESISFFAALTVSIMIFYSYRAAIKMGRLKKPCSIFEVIWAIAGIVVFLYITARHLISTLDEFCVWRTFRRMGCGTVLAWIYITLTILMIAGYWMLWKKCIGFSRRLFTLPAVLMPTFRWGYALLMNLGILPYIEQFVGIPFKDRYVVYDLMCLGVLGAGIWWKRSNVKILLVRTPVLNVSMVIEEDILERIIEEKAKSVHERTIIQMKRFFYGTAEEMEENVYGKIGLVSFLIKNAILEADDEEEIVARVKVNESYVYLVGEVEEEVYQAEEWLAKFVNQEELKVSYYIMPKMILDEKEE